MRVEDIVDRLRSALAGRYTLERELGRGGMATVWLARDEKHDRLVALKVLRPEVAQALGPERFLREIKLTAGLDHPHILPLLDSGEAGGFLYYTMPYVEGESLRDRLVREKQLPIDDALAITREVADALGYAHSRGVVHRDIKPENILLAGGHARVADFGIARAITAAGGERFTETGITVGTPAYMSPEQAAGARDLDGRSDVYALGCVLYEMLAGEPPFTGPSAQAILARQSLDPVPRLRTVRETVPEALEAAVMRALAKTPADRFNPVALFTEALRGTTTGLDVEPEGLRPLKATDRSHGPEKSIAVLPFINDSPDQENTYFINGVMEEILGNLQKIKALRVISRTSVEQYRDRKKSVREIADELGVNYIVEGSAQKYGSAFRLRTQLIMAERESHLWGESFQQKITDVEDLFNIQIRIAKSIAEELEAVISPEEKRLIEKIPAADLAVYDEYLKARSYVYDGRREALNKALEFLTSAIAKNPGWAHLYAGLAEAWLWMQQNAFEQPSVAGPQIIENLNKALALDPDLAEAHYLSAMVAHLVDWDWGRSEREFLRALAINPNDALSRGLYAQLLLIQHRKEEALAQLGLALSLDPLNPMMKLVHIGTLLQAGDYQASLSLAEEALAYDPDNFNLNQMIEIAAYRLQQYDKALRAVRHILPFPLEEDAYEDIERIYSESGIVAAYGKIVERLEKHAESQPVGFWDMAFRYLVADQPEKAMDWVEKGFEMHDPLMTYITTPAHYLDRLFGDPRFIAICKKMNLPLPQSG